MHSHTRNSLISRTAFGILSILFSHCLVLAISYLFPPPLSLSLFTRFVPFAGFPLFRCRGIVVSLIFLKLIPYEKYVTVWLERGGKMMGKADADSSPAADTADARFSLSLCAILSCIEFWKFNRVVFGDEGTSIDTDVPMSHYGIF